MKNLFKYAAEKRDDSIGNSKIDVMQDWFEAEMEIDNELDVFDFDERDFQFLETKIE